MRTLALALLVAGCGDNTMTANPDMASAYLPDIQMEDLANNMPPAATTAIVTTSSFMPMGSGTLDTVALADHKVNMGVDNTLDQDNDVFYGDGMAFVLDHTHSSLRVYDPKKNFATPVEIKLSANGNPHAVAAIPTTTRAYVTMYGNDAAEAVAVIDWSMPQAGVVKSIALPQAAGDPDGKPEANDAYLCGQFVYVTLDDLDEGKGFAPTGPARIAAIDTRSDALDAMNGVIQLMGPNPNGIARSSTGCDEVLVADAANQFGAVDGSGGVEAVDLSLRKSKGMLLKDGDLMGHPSTMSTNPAKTLAYTILTVSNGSGSQVVAIDYLAKKVVPATILPTASFIRFAQVSPDGQLFVGVDFPPMMGPPQAGLWIGPADGTALAGPPLDLGQAPYSIAFF